MTDTDIAESAGAGTSESAGVALAGSDSGAATGSDGDWTAGLSEDNRKLVTDKAYTDPNALADAYRNAESKLGTAVVPPGDDASDEEVAAFYGKLGRPDSPDGYEFKLPSDAPAEMPYSDDLAKTFKASAHAAGLTPSQAQAVHDSFVSLQAQNFAAEQNRIVERVGDAAEALVKKFGGRDTEEFKRATQFADRAVSELGLRDEFKAVGLLTPDNSVTSAKVTIALATIGERMFGEDGLAEGHVTQENPWNPDTFNLTEQGRLKREDPERAKMLAAQYGKKLNV